MQKLLSLCFLFLFLCTHAQKEDQVEQLINHANTHYWLGRYWKNSLQEFLISRKYIDSAEVLLNNSSIDSAVRIKFAHRILAFKSEINEIQDICIDNMNGKYPLFMTMMGEIDNYEKIDDPLEIACEKAIDKLLNTNTFKPSKPLSDLMNFGVVEIHPYDPGVEEVCCQYINNNSNTYVISRHELATLLESNSNLYGTEELKKIAVFFNVNTLGKYTVTVNDQIDGVHYVRATFDYIDPFKNSILSQTLGEGLIVDKTGVSVRAFLFALMYSVPLLILMFLVLFLLMNKFFYEKKWPGIKQTGIAVSGSALGFLISLIASICLLKASNAYAPDPDQFYMAMPALLWRFLTPLIFGMIAPLSALLVIGLVTKKFFYSSQATTYGVFFGALVGGVFPTMLYYYELNETILSLEITFTYVLVSSVAGLFAGIEYFKWDRKGKGVKQIITLILFMIPLVVFHFILLEELKTLSDFQYLKIILSFLPAFISYFFLTKILELFVSKGKTGEVIPGKIGALSKIVNLTISSNKEELKELFVSKGMGGNEVFFPLDFNQHIKNLFKDKIRDLSNLEQKIGVLHIKGPRGIGKTTLIKDVLQNDDFGYCFYGDCDEFQDGNTIPYEPFVQAFGPFLGEGIFLSGDRHAKKIIDQIKPGLEQTPFGNLALSMIDTQSFSGASPYEICKVFELFITSTINENIKKNKRTTMFFVLDDIHWIDENTVKLFDEFMKMVRILKKKLKFDFTLIIGEREEKDDTRLDQNHFDDFLNSLATAQYYKFDSLLKDINSERSILVGNDFCDEFLSKCGVEIHFKTRQMISSYFVSQGFYNPGHILECLNYIIQHHWLSEENGVLVLKKDADLKNLPLPSQLKELFAEKFDQLDYELKRILETASFIGEFFEANTLAEIWNVDRLELLHKLRIAEEIGLVIDISEKDDVYQFSSKGLISELRRYASKGMGDNERPQIVKEYHKMITRIMLGEGENMINPETFDLNIVCQLADRTFFTRDQMPEDAFKLNYIAAKRCLNKVNTQQAKVYADRLVDLLKDVKVDECQMLKVNVIRLKIALVTLSAANRSKAIDLSLETEELFTNVFDHQSKEQIELYKDFYLDFLQLYFNSLPLFSKDDSINKQDHENEIKRICNAENLIVDIEIIRFSQKFYWIETFLYGRDKSEEKIKSLSELKDELEKLGFQENALYGRVINSIANILFNEQALELWKKRLKLVIKLNKIDVSPKDTIALFSTLRKEFSSMDFNSKKDVLYSSGGIARYFYTIEKNYELSLKLNLDLKAMNMIAGDYQGYSIAGTYIGYCYKELYKRDQANVSIIDDCLDNYEEMYYELENSYQTLNGKAIKDEDAISQLTVLINWIDMIRIANKISEKDLKRLDTAIEYFIATFYKDEPIKTFHDKEVYEIIKSNAISNKTAAIQKLFSITCV